MNDKPETPQTGNLTNTQKTAAKPTVNVQPAATHSTHAHGTPASPKAVAHYEAIAARFDRA